MPARILPDKTRLRQMIDQGMTHREIAEVVSRETGQPVRRSTVSAAIHRAGLSDRAKKYDVEIPWTVRDRHLTSYPARMLRLLGRRRAGLTLTAEQESRLDSWLAMLERENAVVVYFPETEEGFFYVEGDPYVDGVPVDPEYKVSA